MTSRATAPSHSSSRWACHCDKFQEADLGSKTLVFKSLLFVLGVGLLTTAATAAELKIGYVNAVKVIEEAPQGEAALKKLEAEFAPRDKKIVEMQNRVKEIEQEMEKNALVLKDAERRAKEYEIGALKRDLRRTTHQFPKDYNLRPNEIGR